MVSVKIECGCGQHYAFDVEPVNDRMTSTVACPSCGADGTAEANSVIASQSSPPPDREMPTEPPTLAGARLKLNHSESGQPSVPAGLKRDARSLGLVDRDTAENEARAKISWGDSPDEVTKYLMLQGFSVPDATELVQALYQERLAALRVKGIRKIVAGIGMMFVPVIAWGAFAHIGFISLKLMAVAVMVGLYGCWELINGILTLVAPKMESGDVAE